MTVVARMSGCSSMMRSLSRAQRGVGRRLNHAELRMLELPGVEHQARCRPSPVAPVAVDRMTGSAEVNPDLVRASCADLHLDEPVVASPCNCQRRPPVDGGIDGELLGNKGLDASEVELADRAFGEKAGKLRRRRRGTSKEHHSARRCVEAMHEVDTAVLDA